MTMPNRALVDDRTSLPEQPVPADVLASLADAAPSNVAAHAPLVRPDVAITEDELRRLTIDLVLGGPARADSPRARELRERLRGEIMNIQARPGASVDVSSDVPEGE